MHPLLGQLVVLFVVLLISFIAYSSQIFIIWPWYGRALSIELLALLGPFNILVGMLLWNYSLTVHVDPGRVPREWKPDTHADGFEVKKLTGAPRFCRMCEAFKPPRSHHCRTCKRCVLRMDHHCPWTNNCVGHFNYGHFIRFLFYVDLACAYHLAMVTRRVMLVAGSPYYNELSTTELVLIILNYVACIPVMLAVGGFSIYHFLGLMGNSTTIEGWEKDKAATMVRHGRIREIKFPYNLGRRKNIEAVLGKNPLWWCWPTVTPGNGLAYKLADTDGMEIDSWPPRAPNPYDNDDHGRFELPDSPWTYENGDVNPDLQPSNSQRRQDMRQRRPPQLPNGASAFPPYHPDYQADHTDQYPIDSDSEDSDDGTAQPRVRRGSEGYEIRPVQREEMLHRYLEQLGEKPGRYHRYIPMPDEESDEEDDTPLGQRLQQTK